jgi:hypothetical protein
MPPGELAAMHLIDERVIGVRRDVIAEDGFTSSRQRRRLPMRCAELTQ